MPRCCVTSLTRRVLRAFHRLRMQQSITYEATVRPAYPTMPRAEDIMAISHTLLLNRVRAGCACLLMGMLLVLAAAPAQSETARTTPYQYVSPLPGARFVPPSHNIVIRDGRVIDRSTVADASLSVRGSGSGVHAGSLILSDDAKTLVFLPERPFSPGEVVEVQLNRGPTTIEGTELPQVSFSFEVSPVNLRQESPALSQPWLDPVLPGSVPSSPHFPEEEGVSRPAAAAATDLPPDYPDIFVMSSNNPEPGEIFLTPFGFSAPPPPNNRGPMVIVDNLGMPLYFNPLTRGGLTLTPQQGKLTYWDHAKDQFYVMDHSYAVIDSFWMKNGYGDDHHDLQLLPNGHALIAGRENRPVGMDTVIVGGDPNAIVQGCVIQELDLAKNVVFEWKSLDYIDILDGDPKSVNFLGPVVRYFVFNAVEMDHDGNILISARYINQIIKVNRQTGDVIWRFGVHGNHNDFTVIGDSRGFKHQHDIRRLPNGNITLYDNGNWLVPLKSRALEFELDEVGMVATLVWEYTDFPDRYGHFMGSMQRRASGGTMVTWGGTKQHPKITDLHPDGTTAFELSFSHPPGNYGSYRAFRAPWRTTRFVTDVDDLDFGRVAPGASDTQSLTIRNNWESEVMITSFVSTDPAFRVLDAVPLTIPVGGMRDVDVVFEPGVGGAFQGILYVRSVSDIELVARRVALQGVSNSPPDCGNATASLTGLWPPNHKLVPVEILGVLDPDGDPVTITVTGVTQDEPVVGAGSGNHCPDAVIENDRVMLRAERLGQGNGRVYEISFRAEDGNGGVCEGTVSVCVGHDQGVEPGIVANRDSRRSMSRICFDDDPQIYDALGLCPLNNGGTPTKVVAVDVLSLEAGAIAGNRATVAYTLPQDSDVHLSVYDITGRRVAVVENASHIAGAHQASWNISGLSPGVYFYRLRAGAAIVTKSVLILR